MTNDVKRCDFYKKESQNVGTRWGCQVPKAYFTCEQHLRNLQIPNTKEECEVSHQIAYAIFGCSEIFLFKLIYTVYKRKINSLECMYCVYFYGCKPN